MAQGGQNSAAVEAAGPGRGARQQNPRRLKVHVKIVYAHNTILHVKFADMKIRYPMEDGIPQWAKELINFVEIHGRHKKVKRVGYSRFWRGRIVFQNDVYEMKISLITLMELITMTKTWKKSPIAKKIVEKINELTRSHE